MDPFKGEMAFVGEDPRVSKSSRGIEPADESKTVAFVKRPPLLLQEEKEGATHRKMAVRKDDLLRFDQELSGFLGPVGNAVNETFHRDSIEADESGDMGWGMGRMEVEMDRKDSESQEKEKKDPGTPAGSFQNHQEEPEAEKGQKRKDQALKGKRQVKLA
jgi:hypothetical protein